MVQSICGRETVKRNRNKAGVTINDGCDGILYIAADSENIVTIDATVTGDEKRMVRRWEVWNMCRRGYKVWEDSRADSVKYLELCDKYFIGWMRKYGLRFASVGA